MIRDDWFEIGNRDWRLLKAALEDMAVVDLTFK